MLVTYLAITSFVFKDFLKTTKQSNISIKKSYYNIKNIKIKHLDN